MKEFNYTVKDSVGIHARPAGLLVKEAAKFACETKIINGEKSADAKKLFGIMGLGVKCGDTVTVTCNGDGEDEAIAAIEKFFNENL